MTNEEKIQYFIDNNIDLSGVGSELNANCVPLAGYACYLELDWDNLHDIIANLDEEKINLSSEEFNELERVFEYAQYNNYGDYWTSEEAKKFYKFIEK